MPRYFIQLSYDGTAYHGWQVQENANTVQAELSKSLSRVVKGDVSIVGAGRTDTGVHAKMMMAHFDWEETIKETGKLAYQLNAVLPNDIAVQKISIVDEALHARFSAMSRTYEYHITNIRDPFLINRAYYFHPELNNDKMNEAAAILMKHEDFTSFSKLHTDTNTNLCNVSSAQWKKEGKMNIFTISANRFLRNMVRAIVGTLMEVGKGKMSLDEFEAVINKKDRSEAGFSVPAHGLYLTDIAYPAPVKSEMEI